VALIVIGKEGAAAFPHSERNCALRPKTGRPGRCLSMTGGSISNTFGVTLRMTLSSGATIALRVARLPRIVRCDGKGCQLARPGGGGGGAAPLLSLVHVSPRTWFGTVSTAGKRGVR
jgi:hypothetical protein